MALVSESLQLAMSTIHQASHNSPPGNCEAVRVHQPFLMTPVASVP